MSLLNAASGGDVDEVRLLLERGADVNVKETDGVRLLFISLQIMVT